MSIYRSSNPYKKFKPLKIVLVGIPHLLSIASFLSWNLRTQLVNNRKGSQHANTRMLYISFVG